MAGIKRPSFLKRQKEQQRRAKQAEKREARQTRKGGRSSIHDVENMKPYDGPAADPFEHVLERMEEPTNEPEPEVPAEEGDASRDG